MITPSNEEKFFNNFFRELRINYLGLPLLANEKIKKLESERTKKQYEVVI